MEPRAGFAVRTKKPGDSRDYRVLAMGGGELTPEAYEELYRRLSVGSLGLDPPPAPGAAPWITCGPYGSGESTMIAVVRQEWTEVRDRDSRSVSAATCLALPYSALRETPAGYVDLLRALPSQADLMDRTEPLPVEVGPHSESIERWSRLVQTLSVRFCASVAAAVLESPVALVGADLPLGEARLEYLDAIAALLPYGVRASLVVSTWMEAASPHFVHIGFCRAPRSGERRMRWGDPTAAAFKTDGPSDRYLRMLLEVGERRGLPWLMARLAEHRAAMSLDEPQTFTDTVWSLDRAHLVWKSVADGRGRWQEATALFDSGEAEDLNSRKRLDLLNYLLKGERFEPAAHEVVSAHWNADLWLSLKEAGVAAVQSRGRRQTLLRLSDLAAEQRLLPQFIRVLLDHVNSRPESQDSNDNATATLIELLDNKWDDLNRSLVGLSDNLMRDPLVANRALMIGFVARALQWDNAELGPLLDRLEAGDDELRRELEVFRIAAGLPNDAAPSAGESTQTQSSGTPDRAMRMIERLAAFPSAYVLDVLQAAARRPDHAGLELLTPPITLWFTDNHGRLPEAELSVWRVLLPDIRGETSSHPARAALDLCFTLLSPDFGRLDLASELEASAGDFRKYADTFVELASSYDRADQTDIVKRCLRAPCSSEAGAANLLYLLDKLWNDDLYRGTQTGPHERVVNLISEYPTLVLSDAFTQSWERRLAMGPRGPEVVAMVLRAAIILTTPIGEAAELAARLVLYNPARLGPLVVQSLGETTFFGSLDELLQFRDALLSGLARSLPTGSVLRVEAEFGRAVRTGKLAANLSDEYIESVQREYRYKRAWLEIVGPMVVGIHAVRSEHTDPTTTKARL